MYKDLIVAIFAPTTGKGQQPGCVGTGYPVTNDLILTSRHVVQPENRDDAKPIRIKWFYAKDEPSDWISIGKDDLVWTGEKNLDAVLIRCQRPESLRKFPFGRLTERKPTDGERWQSTGFARANKRDDVREPGQFGGTLRTMAEGDSFFEVIEDAEPTAEDQWKGVSGMPVFVGSEILGVVKHVPQNFGHKKLEAVPSWRLRQDEGFRKALGLDERKALGLDEQHERLESARQLLHELLKDSNEVVGDLTSALPGNPSGLDQVIEQLLTHQPLESLFRLALSIQEKRRKKKDRNGEKVARDLVLAILPAIHDAVIVSDVRRRKSDANEYLIGLPTELRTLAEIIMAGTDRRAARLRPPPPKTKGYFPAGELNLPEPPESGRDADGKQFAKDWHTHLVDVFGKGDADFHREFRMYLKERFIQSDMRSRSTGDAEEKLRQSIAGELKYLVETERLTYYFIAEISASSEVAKQQEAMLARLKTDFPSLVFLRLAGGEGLDVERGRYRRLCDLLAEDSESNQ